MQESAAKGYPEAMFDEGQMLVTGNQLPKDLQKGLDLLRRSANLGSWPAQYLLGSIYERGGEVDKDLERSRRYFRLCAATGEHLCQERLGASLVRQAGRQEREYVQGVAWLELAEQGDADAEALMAKERPGLTLELISRIEKLKPQLVRKN
jgi:TPR repeat protein